MKTLLPLVLTFAVGSAAPAQTIETFSPKKELRARVVREKMADASVIKKTLRAGLMELQLIQLAGENTASAEVQKLSVRLGSESEELNRRLGDLALAAGVEIPVQPSKMMRDRVESVSRLTGAEFDAAFLQAMAASRRGTIGVFEMTSAGARNQALQELAGQMLPVLQEASMEIEGMTRQIAGEAGGESQVGRSNDSALNLEKL